MVNELIKFIRSYIELSDEEANIVKDSSLINSFKKNTLLLSEGDYSNEYYFIIKGCVRTFYIIDGEERTTEFYTENQSIIPASFFNKKPSDYYISCIEDCVIAIGSEERDQALISKIPKLNILINESNIQLRIQNQLFFDNFKNKSSEQLYLYLLETRPELFNRVPLKYIATYLGITPVSLSRMRKRIHKK